MLGGKRKGLIRSNCVMPLVTKPNRTGFSHRDSPIDKPMSTRAFKSHRANLFATTFDSTTANHIPLFTKVSIIHASHVILVIGSGR